MRADAYHPTRPHPEAVGLRLATLGVLEKAGWRLDEVDYINLHGTGTALNDQVERRAIAELWAQATRAPLASGVKGSIGHSLGAAGLIELAVVARCLERGLIPPTANGKNIAVNEEAGPCRIVGGKPERRALRRAVSVNSAFGGHNTAIALSLGHRRGVQPINDLGIAISSCVSIPRGPEESADLLTDLTSRPARLERSHWRAADRLARLALSVSCEALETDDGPRPGRLALFLATDRGPTAAHQELVEALKSGRHVNPALFPKLTFTYCAGLICEALGITGPTLTLTSGRIGTIAAMNLAATVLRDDEADAVLIVGVDTGDEFAAGSPKYRKSEAPLTEGAACAVVRRRGAGTLSVNSASTFATLGGLLASGFVDKGDMHVFGLDAPGRTMPEALAARLGKSAEMPYSDIDLGAAGPLATLAATVLAGKGSSRPENWGIMSTDPAGSVGIMYGLTDG